MFYSSLSVFISQLLRWRGECDPPEESEDQEAMKPPLDTLWSARNTTAILFDPDWMAPGEVVPQYWPITGAPGDPPLKMVTESQLHWAWGSRLK